MHEAGIRPDKFAQMRQKGDDVMLDLAFDGVDFFDVEHGRTAFFPDGFGAVLSDHADFCQSVAGMRLDLEPDAELGFG